MNRRSALAAGAALLVCLPALARAGAASSALLALDGIDPVSYFDPGKPEKGSARIGYDYGGQRYLFVSEKHRAAFAADPQRYLPQFGEQCTAGLSQGIKSEADPRQFKVVDGKLYLFSGPTARGLLDKDPALLDKAQKNWLREKGPG
jgi:YHS domain-containing protein